MRNEEAERRAREGEQHRPGDLVRSEGRANDLEVTKGAKGKASLVDGDPIDHQASDLRAEGIHELAKIGPGWGSASQPWVVADEEGPKSRYAAGEKDAEGHVHIEECQALES